MSKGGFSGGFLLGALLGGAIGGAIGAAAASRGRDGRKPLFPNRETRDPAIDPADPDATRRELEAKIARLNDTIDDVREQLHFVHKRVPDADKTLEAVLDDAHN
ncbi:MAG: hypothetical protein ACFB9N_08705 [Geitlerinemataceae cyanobacterium]